MFNEPIEERYNDVLRQRVALEGQLSLLKSNHQQELKIAHKRSNRYLLLLLLLPLTTLLCKKKIDPSVYERQLTAQRDSIQQITQDLVLEKNRKHTIKYVIRKGDMLTSLGELFFNNRESGYQIGLDNGIKTEYQLYHLVPGDTLLINIP